MIYIDIDGVVTNIVKTINKLFDKDIKSLSYYDFRELSFKNEIFAMFNDIEKMDKYCIECEPNIEFIRILKGSGVEFEFLTARPVTCHDATVNWLKAHGFNQTVHHSLDKNNFMKRGDVLIDDCAKNIAQLKNGRVGYCYLHSDHHYNEEYVDFKIKKFVKDEGLVDVLKQHQKTSLLHEIQRLNKLNPIKRTPDIIMLKLMEEVGELSSAMQQKLGHNKHREDNISEECVDVVLCALSIALQYTAVENIEEMLSRKMDKWENRYTINASID